MDAKRARTRKLRNCITAGTAAPSAKCARRTSSENVFALRSAALMKLSARFSASVAALSLAAVSLLHAQDITNKDLLDGLANPSRWLTHSGDYSGARFSPLTQITPANAAQLSAQWTFQTNVVNKF